jgi:hypothetical protein
MTHQYWELTAGSWGESAQSLNARSCRAEDESNAKEEGLLRVTN